jgi:hypothetical protein
MHVLNSKQLRVETGLPAWKLRNLMKIRDDMRYVLVAIVESARAKHLEQSDDAPSLWVKSDFPEPCAAISREIDFG